MIVRVRPLDTDKRIDDLQMKLLRTMTPEQRLHLGFQLSRMSRRLQEEGVRRRHPDYSEEQVRLAVARVNLGEELFRKAYPHWGHLVP